MKWIKTFNESISEETNEVFSLSEAVFFIKECLDDLVGGVNLDIIRDVIGEIDIKEKFNTKSLSDFIERIVLGISREVGKSVSPERIREWMDTNIEETPDLMTQISYFIDGIREIGDDWDVDIRIGSIYSTGG
jgi:hypothetical protein